MYNMPPPIMTETYMASAMEPASRNFMYATYGYSSTVSSAICLSMASGIRGAFSASTSDCISDSMLPEVNWSELSTTSPICGRFCA